MTDERLLRLLIEILKKAGVIKRGTKVSFPSGIFRVDALKDSKVAR